MKRMQFLVGVVTLLIATSQYGLGPDESGQLKYIRRPYLVDSGYLCARVAAQGTYAASVGDRIEIDLLLPGPSGCGITTSTCVSDQPGIVKSIAPKYRAVDDGIAGDLFAADFFKAVKKGEANITLTLDGQVSFIYHIVVE